MGSMLGALLKLEVVHGERWRFVDPFVRGRFWVD